MAKAHNDLLPKCFLVFRPKEIKTISKNELKGQCAGARPVASIEIALRDKGEQGIIARASKKISAGRRFSERKTKLNRKILEGTT